MGVPHLPPSAVPAWRQVPPFPQGKGWDRPPQEREAQDVWLHLQLHWDRVHRRYLPNPFSKMAAKVGDRAVFKYSSRHDVHLHKSGSCDKKGSKLVGSTTAGRVSFRFSKAGEYTFACQQGSHCKAGQIITFEVKP